MNYFKNSEVHLHLKYKTGKQAGTQREHCFLGVLVSEVTRVR